MAPNANKDPIGDLIDKLRSFFGFGDRPKNQSAIPAKKRFSIWYFVLAMILFYYLQPMLSSSKIETISYSQFKQYVEQGIAGDLVIGPESINGTLTGSPKRSFATCQQGAQDRQ